MPISRRLKVILAALAVTGLIGVLMRSAGLRALRRYGDAYLSKQPFVRQPLTEEQLADVRSNPDWIADPFEVAPGVVLDGIVHTPKTPDRPWVLYFSGNTGAGLADTIRDYEAYGRDADWGYASWSYRGYGASTGISSKDTIRSDSVRVADRLLNHWHVAPGQLRLLGTSLGTAPATHAAMVLSRRNQIPAGAVFISTGFRQWSFVRSLLYDVTSETSRRDAIECPILITHGLLDTTHRPEAALEDFAALKKSDAVFLLVRGGHDHGAMPQVAQQIREFIEHPSASKRTTER